MVSTTHVMLASPHSDPILMRRTAIAKRPTYTKALADSTTDAETCRPTVRDIDQRPIEFACECD